MAKVPARSAGDDRRYVVISTDGHDGPPDHPEKLLAYLPARHHDEFQAFLDSGGGFVNPHFSNKERPYQGFFEDWAGMDDEWIDEAIERHWAAEPELLDPKRRIAVLEQSGVAAELLLASPPMLPTADAETKAAIRDAHLRWMIDYCNAVPGRLAGIIDVDYTDVDAAIATIRRGRDAGLFGGILTPGRQSLFAMGQDVPGIVDPHWEPIWDLAEELDLPLITHGAAAPDAMTAYPSGDPSTWFGMMVLESPYFSVRNLLLLMGAGVLDRHPALKLAFIEQQVAFIPGLLHDFDQEMENYSVQRFRRSLNMLPSEYWRRHAFVGASFLDPRSTAVRHELGIENLMWGGDYPHPEGSWPNVLPALQFGLGGLPEDELRAILGLNAAQVWGFDLDLLQGIADRVGPTVDDLAAPLPHEEIPLYTTGVAFGAPRRLAATGSTSAGTSR